MLWVNPPSRSLWNEPVGNLSFCGFWSPSIRAVRILRLQGLYTVGQLADAALSGALRMYPAWLRDEALRALQMVRPAIERENREQQIRAHDRRERMSGLDWAKTAISRPLSEDESASLTRITVRRLDCAWGIKHIAWYLNAVDALDAAILDRGLLLTVETCGPARIEGLRITIERALRGEVQPDESTAPPPYKAPNRSLARRPLVPAELTALAREPLSDLPLPGRAVHELLERRIETCLDLAVMLDYEVRSLPGIGRRTLRLCQDVIAGRLSAIQS